MLLAQAVKNFILLESDLYRKRYKSSHVFDIDVTMGPRGPWSPKFLAYLVILRFAGRCHKQNTVARLKSKELFPQNSYDWLRYWCLRF